MSGAETVAAEARADDLRNKGECPGCGERFTDRGAMKSLRELVMLHEALVCPKYFR